MKKEEITDYLSTHKDEAYEVVYQLLKNETLSIGCLVSFHELLMKDKLSHLKGEVVEGNTIALMYHDKLYGSGRGRTKGELDQRAEDYLIRNGYFKMD